MFSAPLAEQDTFIVQFETTSPGTLAKHGLACIERGLYAEGIMFFALASERLPSHQIQCIAALESLRRAVAGYLHAQDALLAASKQLAASDAEQQAQIVALKKLLPLLTEAEVTAKMQPSSPIHKVRTTQSLRLVRPDEQMDGNEEQAGGIETENTASRDGQTLPALHVTCFGRFEVRRGFASTESLDLCSNAKGQAILRYLITQPQRRASIDRLMAALWPDEEPEAARHKLRVAVSALRCSLNRDVVDRPGGGYILCKGQVYSLNPAVTLHSDVDTFLALYHAGQAASGREAMAFYERACNLYTGPFLVEDLYAEWSYIPREELTKTYVTMCDSLAEFALTSGSYEATIKWACAILQVDRCDEKAHRQLIRAYYGLGRRSEALRQYLQCQRILHEELGVLPMPETQQLFSLLVDGMESPTGREHAMKGN